MDGWSKSGLRLLTAIKKERKAQRKILKMNERKSKTKKQKIYCKKKVKRKQRKDSNRVKANIEK